MATGKRQRRTFTQDFKRDLVAQTLVSGASVSGIALVNGINTNQLFAWRRQLQASITAPAVPALLPVHLDLTDIATSAASAPAGHIEIAFGRATVRLHGQVDSDALRVVLQCLAH